MRTLILAGVSAIALALGGAAHAAGSSSAGSGTTHNPTSMSSGSSSQAGHAMNASSSEIKQAQQTLKSDGLYKGQVDGIDGPETKQALEQFQKKNGLKQTGSLDQKTMAKLNGGSGQAVGAGSSTPPASGSMSGSGSSNGSSMGGSHAQPSSGGSAGSGMHK